MSSELTGRQKAWALAAAVPFLLSLALLGFALDRQAFLAFAIGWPLLQIMGYIGALKRANGNFDHMLVKTQVALHWMMIALLGAIVARAT